MAVIYSIACPGRCLRCGGLYTGSSGSISSPNYPDKYGNKLHCVYIIDAGETLITLVFKDFNTESSYDFVKVYDASNNLLVRLSGDRWGYIVQSAVYYRVVFTTDSSRVRKGFKAVWTVAKDSSARFGGYATLSWTLPDPGTSEFSVCNSETKKCLLHITGYNDVRAASDKFTSRVRFIGHVSSSGTGLFRFVLSDVTWEDEGHYKCYRGSPGSGGPIIPDCGQKLVVQGRTPKETFDEMKQLMGKMPHHMTLELFSQRERKTSSGNSRTAQTIINTAASSKIGPRPDRRCEKTRPNFTKEESLLLAELVASNKVVIEGKFGLCITSLKRQEEWQMITGTLNASLMNKTGVEKYHCPTPVPRKV